MFIQDLSEEMKREREEEMRKDRGAPSLFFMELSTMTGSMGALYVLGIMAFFGIIFYVLINKLLKKPVDFSK